jgi:hypothetical protein
MFTIRDYGINLMLEICISGNSKRKAFATISLVMCSRSKQRREFKSYSAGLIFSRITLLGQYPISDTQESFYDLQVFFRDVALRAYVDLPAVMSSSKNG